MAAAVAVTRYAASPTVSSTTATRPRRRSGRTGARDYAEAIGGALDAESTPWRPDLGARCMDGTAAVSTAAGRPYLKSSGFERPAQTSIVIAAAGVRRAASSPLGGSQAGTGQSSAPRCRASPAVRSKAVRPPGEPLTVTTARAAEGCVGLGRTSRCAGKSSAACLPADVPPTTIHHVRTPAPATCTTSPLRRHDLKPGLTGFAEPALPGERDAVPAGRPGRASADRRRPAGRLRTGCTVPRRSAP